MAEETLEDALNNAQEMLKVILMSYTDNDMVLPSQLDEAVITDGFLKVISVGLQK